MLGGLVMRSNEKRGTLKRSGELTAHEKSPGFHLVQLARLFMRPART